MVDKIRGDPVDWNDFDDEQPLSYDHPAYDRFRQKSINSLMEDPNEVVKRYNAFDQARHRVRQHKDEFKKGLLSLFGSVIVCILIWLAYSMIANAVRTRDYWNNHTRFQLDDNNNFEVMLAGDIDYERLLVKNDDCLQTREKLERVVKEKLLESTKIFSKFSYNGHWFEFKEVDCFCVACTNDLMIRSVWTCKENCKHINAKNRDMVIESHGPIYY